MKILLDHSAPIGLARHLHGHEVKRTSQIGWGEVSNGSLLRLAEQSGYRLMITADKNIPWQNTVSGRLLGILELSTNNWRVMQLHIPAIVEAVGQAQPGKVKSVFCGRFVHRRYQRRSP